ncbi:hypothetical protein FTX61_05335 [Nitriliruptoraceae bacterium ZYF776]|nr:hypothetical protein [Profundirhabdus halotolerans]
MTVRTAGSLWSVPVEAQADVLRAAHAAGLRHVHWDLADGEFAPAGGFDVERAAELTAPLEGLVAEAHLMVARPLTVVDAWTELCDLVVVHAEVPEAAAACRRIEARGARPGLAVRLGTPLAPLVSAELPVLTMSIEPGHAGSRFDPLALTRLRTLRDGSAPDRLLGVDGGVTDTLARDALDAGASWVVSGTSLFGADDPAAWLAAVEERSAAHDHVRP